MLPPCFLGGGRDMVYNFYSPMKNKVVSLNNRGGREEAQLMQDEKTKLVGSSHGWLALYNSRNRSMCLSNPVSGRRIDLPPLAGKPFFREETPQKLIMSCPPDEEDCRAVLILGDRVGRGVAFCCPARSTHWAPLGEWPRNYDDDDDGDSFSSVFNSNDSDFATARLYVDVAYSASRKRFVAFVYSLSRKRFENDLDFGNEVEYWDISEPLCARMDRVELVGPHSKWIEDPYIVCAEESDQLFLVEQCAQIIKRMDSFSSTKDGREVDLRFHYDVYRIGDGGALELCSSLDDHAMFVGISHSHSVASQFPPNLLKTNCIYFADPSKQACHGQHIHIFDYQNRTCSPLYFPNRLQKTQSPMSWITPTFD